MMASSSSSDSVLVVPDWLALPGHVWQHVFCRLPFEDYAAARLTCKAWCSALESTPGIEVRVTGQNWPAAMHVLLRTAAPGVLVLDTGATDAAGFQLFQDVKVQLAAAWKVTLIPLPSQSLAVQEHILPHLARLKELRLFPPAGNVPFARLEISDEAINVRPITTPLILQGWHTLEVLHVNRLVVALPGASPQTCSVLCTWTENCAAMHAAQHARMPDVLSSACMPAQMHRQLAQEEVEFV